MSFLIDTHLLLWLAQKPELLAPEAAAILADTENEIHFSTASLWELAIKFALHKPDFDMDPLVLREYLLQAGYRELFITGDHAIEVARLPLLPQGSVRPAFGCTGQR